MDKIIVKGARENNLKNIDIELPKNKLIVMTGVSGSGKSSLAFDTIFAEGQRRYVESLSAYARQFIGISEKPDVDSIEGLSPSISIDQKTTNKNYFCRITLPHSLHPQINPLRRQQHAKYRPYLQTIHPVLGHNPDNCKLCRRTTPYPPYCYVRQQLYLPFRPAHKPILLRVIAGRCFVC